MALKCLRRSRKHGIGIDGGLGKVEANTPPTPRETAGVRWSRRNQPHRTRSLGIGSYSILEIATAMCCVDEDIEVRRSLITLTGTACSSLSGQLHRWGFASSF
jgi:hypothetical protein